MGILGSNYGNSEYLHHVEASRAKARGISHDPHLPLAKQIAALQRTVESMAVDLAGAHTRMTELERDFKEYREAHK